jgi:hypothetical protein
MSTSFQTCLENRRPDSSGVPAQSPALEDASCRASAGLPPHASPVVLELPDRAMLKKQPMTKPEVDRVSPLPEMVMLSVSLLVVASIGILSYRNSQEAVRANTKLGISRSIRELTTELVFVLKTGFLLTGRAE